MARATSISTTQKAEFVSHSRWAPGTATIRIDCLRLWIDLQVHAAARGTDREIAG